MENVGTENNNKSRWLELIKVLPGINYLVGKDGHVHGWKKALTGHSALENVCRLVPGQDCEGVLSRLETAHISGKSMIFHSSDGGQWGLSKLDDDFLMMSSQNNQEDNPSKYLQKIFQLLPESAIFIYNQDLKSVRNLPGTLYGNDIAISGQNLMDIVPENLKEWLGAALKDESRLSTTELKDGNGGLYLCRLQKSPDKSDPSVAGLLFYFHLPIGSDMEEKDCEKHNTYRILARNLPNGAVFMFDNNLRFQLAEGQALARTGFPGNVIEGKSLLELELPQRFVNYVRPFLENTLKGNIENFEVVVYGGRIYSVTTAPLNNDGYDTYGGMAIAFDISKQKEISRQLIRRLRDMKKNEDLYRQLFGNIPNGALVTFDKNLKYTFAEGSILEELGLPKDSLVGQSVFDLFNDSTASGLGNHYKSALEGKTVTYEWHSTRTDHTYLVSIIPRFDNKHEIEGGMLLAIDIDHLKAIEKELHDKINDLSQVNQTLNKEIGIRKRIEANLHEYTIELKNKNKELEQFAYVASHDLQEPLRMISSFTQLLAKKQKDESDQDAKEFMLYIIEGTQRMQALINDLLMYSRVGTRGKEFQPVNMNDILSRAKVNMGVTIEETGTIINPENLPVLNGDETQLIQVFQNLISNAIKFRHVDRTPEINIKCKTLPDFFEFRFIDNGIGLDMAHKDRIFQIFQRLNTRDQYPGTGIGLAVCKRIVERHGGEITVESTPGNGATFLFTLKKQ